MARPEPKDVIAWYNEAKSLRAPHETDWRMAAAYCLPRHYSSWQTLHPGTSGEHSAARRFAFDSTGVNALPKFAAILNRLATPESQRWHKIQADSDELMKIYSVRQYFDAVTDKLFKRRYSPRARFTQASGEIYTSIGVYGMGPISVTRRKPTVTDPKGGLAYKAWPMKDVFVLTDDLGNIKVSFRRAFMNARQFIMKFGKEAATKTIAQEVEKPNPSETRYFEIVHILHDRIGDFDPTALDVRRHPITSSYVAVEDMEYVGLEEGFTTMPLLTPRTYTEPGDLYGYSPAIQALPALGGVSTMKKTVLKQGQKAVDPAYLANDDGVLSGRLDIRPGRVNYGGVNAQGNPLVRALETGDFNVAEKLIEDERQDIKDSFFVTLFTILTERPEMTAAEVMETVAEKAALLAPTMGRLQAEWLGPCIEREVALLAEHGDLPEMPPELEEAEGEYSVQYTSPLAKGQYAEEVSGFMRWSELLMNVANVQAAAGDPNLATDWINHDESAPAIANFMSVRTSWVKDKKEVDAIREARAKQQQQSELLKQAPAAAAIGKEVLKNGGGVPGVSN